MDTLWLQKSFIHGNSDDDGLTIAGWLNVLNEQVTVIDIKMCPIGDGHGTLVLALCKERPEWMRRAQTAA